MPTLGGTVIQNARRVPDREAIVFAGRSWTWVEVDLWAGRIAAQLRQFGVVRGDRVALTATNTPDYIVAAYGVLRLGAIVVPVNTRLAVAEFEHVLTDCSPRVCLYSRSTFEVVSRVRASNSSVLFVAFETFDVDAQQPGQQAPIVDDCAVEGDDAFIVYTSGTTGRAKGVVVDHHRAIWASLAQIVSLGFRDGVRYLHLPPLYHSGGVVFLNATTLLGGTSILIDKFEPRAVLEAVEKHSAEALLGVPTMYQFILDVPELAEFDLSSWRTGVFGAAPMPEPTVEALLRLLPSVEFFQQCGQTEAGPTGIYSTFSQVREDPDSSGHLAQPFVVARVIDRDGMDVRTGEVGELVLQGEPVMKGYWGNREASDAALADGWLHTGDLVQVRASGAMKLVDRRKDVIISGGRNIYSAEVEQALRTHPSVEDCAVIGEPNDLWGESVVAVVKASGRLPTLDELRSHCRDLLADYKLPRRVVYRDIPRNAAGKILKNEVREDAL